MNQDASSAPARGPRHWRDIAQEVAPKRMSARGRRRLLLQSLRMLGGIALVVGLVVGMVYLGLLWRADSKKITAPVESVPLAGIKLRTDGVVPDEWIARTLGLEPGVTLMAIDIEDLKTRLTRSGQVRHAVVGREFPDTLRVSLLERAPVGRVRIENKEGSFDDHLIARDGVIYRGVGYDQATLGRLPFIAGFKLRPAEQGYKPVAGMELVAELIQAAIENTPQLYQYWDVIDLRRLATDGELIVQSRHVNEIIFGVDAAFYSQLARLDLIIAESAVRPGQPLHSINLAVDRGHVPVAIQPHSERRIELLAPAGQQTSFRP